MKLNKIHRQEGVDIGMYFPKTVNVTIKGEVFLARTYQQTKNPPKLKYYAELPPERRPSLTYHQVIIQGAMECEIPEEYIYYLFTFPNNGKVAIREIRKQLGPPWWWWF